MSACKNGECIECSKARLTRRRASLVEKQGKTIDRLVKVIEELLMIRKLEGTVGASEKRAQTVENAARREIRKAKGE